MKREIINFKTQSEWLELRAKDITSSEVSALFGLNPYTTEFELHHRKQSNQAVEIEQNERMFWGNKLERAIAEGVSEEKGMDIRPMKYYMRIPELRMGSSFDWEFTSGKLKNWIVEIKNVDSLIFRQNWDMENNEATDYIETQVQHQMEVADRPGCLIVALVGGNKIYSIERKRNKAVGKALRSKIKQFWINVDSGKKPEPDYLRDSEFIIGLHQASGDEILDARADTALLQKVSSYADLKAKIKNYMEMADGKKAELLDLVGDKYKKVLLDGYNFSCGTVKETPDSVVTEAMVGNTVKGRKGYRNVRITKKAVKK